MKYINKVLAFVMASVLALALVGCHPKNEVALTVGGKEYTSAFYMCALLQADNEAKSKVDEEFEEKDKDTTDINYYKQKIDKKKFVDWVEDRATQICRTYAYIETMCDENDVKMSDEDLETAESYAQNYWNNYGYSAYYGANGVAYETFKEYLTYSHLMQTYFISIYGKDGTSAVKEEDVKKTLSERFVLANALTTSLVDESGNPLTDKKIADAKAKMEEYKARLEKGEDFKKIYEEVNGKQENTTTDSAEKPKDELAKVFGAEDTESYASEYFDEINKLKLGEVKVIEDKTNSQLLLVVKKDIMADTYYLNNMYDYIVNLLKFDDFEKECQEKSLELEFEQNKFATDRFNVKKLKSGQEE